MIDDMRRRGITARTAKPLVARQTFYNAACVVDATVTDRKEISSQ